MFPELTLYIPITFVYVNIGVDHLLTGIFNHLQSQFSFFEFHFVSVYSFIYFVIISNLLSSTKPFIFLKKIEGELKKKIVVHILMPNFMELKNEKKKKYVRKLCLTVNEIFHFAL